MNTFEAKKKPLYKEIADHLRNDIKTNYKPDMSLPPQRTLAKRYNTSYVTIGNAINRLVSEGLLIRMVGSGTYVKQIAPATPDLVSVLTSNTDPIYRMTLFGNVEATLRDHAYRPILFSNKADIDEERKSLNDAGQMNERGIILYSVFSEELKHEIKRLIARGIPMVSILKHIEGIDLVRTEHRMVGMLQAQYIARRGLKKIIYISNTSREYGEREKEGFITSLKDSGIKIMPKNIYSMDMKKSNVGEELEELRKKTIYLIVKQAIEQQPDLQAIVIVGDRYLHSVVQALTTKQLKPGRDICLVSSDNQNLPGLPYTTIEEGLAEMGKRAAEMLLDRMNQTYTGAPRTETILPKLIEHKTEFLAG
jgi:DNA-binding LacI/PurR family transcriptional regulator